MIQYLFRNSRKNRSLLFLQKKLQLKPRSFCLTVACARSGSTALVDWLSGQSGVVYAKQSRILPVISRFIRNVDSFESLHGNRGLLLSLGRDLVWRYYVNTWVIWNRILIDKENFDPTVFPDGKFERFLDNINELFPNIKILFLVRDPVATIASMQKKNYGAIALYNILCLKLRWMNVSRFGMTVRY